MHFDDDETWILKKGDTGTDFYWTALHEIGHSLGLDHSNYQNAVMYPFYTGFKENLELNEDDVKGIHYLYGMNNCDTAFKNKKYFQKSDDKVLKPLQTFPFLSSGMPAIKMQTAAPSVTMPTVAPGMPHACSVESFDAVFTDAESKTYFLHGKYVWIVQRTVERRGPFLIESFWPKLPNTGVDAAYYSEGKTIFFKGAR